MSLQQISITRGRKLVFTITRKISQSLLLLAVAHTALKDETIFLNTFVNALSTIQAGSSVQNTCHLAYINSKSGIYNDIKKFHTPCHNWL